MPIQTAFPPDLGVFATLLRRKASVLDAAVLTSLEIHPGWSVRELSLSLRVTKPRLTRCLARLRVRGMVVVRSNHDDRRKVAVTIRPSGKRLLDEIHNSVGRQAGAEAAAA